MRKKPFLTVVKGTEEWSEMLAVIGNAEAIGGYDSLEDFRRLLEVLGYIEYRDPAMLDHADKYGTSQHGTWARYMRHIRDGDTPCGPCRRAATEHRAQYREPKKDRQRVLRPCGTWAAYTRHKANGEEACEACKEAARKRSRDRRKRARSGGH